MATASASQADLVLTGADVYTVDPGRGWARAVAVSGDRILAVGTEEEVAARMGPETRVMPLEGAMILPGFQDAHIHPDHGGLVRSRCDLHDVFGREAYEQAIRAYADGHPNAAWILGGGWALDAFPGGVAHRSILDALVPDRPVFLPNRDGHGAWVNGRALEMAGVTRETPDPADGRIEREEDGTPSGTLHEGAMRLVEDLIPEPTRQELEQALLAAQSYLHSLGITAWQDAHGSEESLAAYVALADRGLLTARVVAALWWDRYRGEEQIEELVRLRASASRGRLKATAVKIMQDGIPENFTAGMLEPYLGPDGRPGDRSGLSFVDPELLKSHVGRLDREGFQVHVHAIGDRAVREALDAFEATRATVGGEDRRHHIAHLQVVHPDDVPRFASLGVVANAQPYWACLDGQMRELCIPFFGPERSGHQYPFASLRRSGAVLAFGSDWPVSTPNPLLEMQVAVTRVPDGEPDVEPFLPHERLHLAAAVEAFTMGSAFVNHLEGETGSIRPGKLADLVVLDRNLFHIDHSALGSAKVLLTLVGGEAVHADPSLGW